MKVFSTVGKRTPVFLRFSTVAGSRGAADTARDPRGFALKVYTEDGNWDLVGNNTPIFFLRDGIKFPDFIHSQKYDPYTNRQEPDNVWDFFSRSPEATHQFTVLFGDRGLPASYRQMDGFGSHTFQWVNAAGERSWVKFHFKSDQGIRCLTAAEAARRGGEDPAYLHKDLYDAIERGDHPSWTLKVQVMPHEAAAPTASIRFAYYGSLTRHGVLVHFAGFLRPYSPEPICRWEPSGLGSQWRSARFSPSRVAMRLRKARSFRPRVGT